MMEENYLIIAHRGEPFDAPENTLAAINLAWERNADAIEIDIHLTKDQKIVVIHDKTTKRTANQNKRIKANVLEDLKKLNFGNSTSFIEKIPTLKEVLATVPAGKKILIEIKCDEKIIPFLRAEIADSGLKREQVEIISFNFKVVKSVKIRLPEHKVLWLLNLDYNWLSKLVMKSTRQLLNKTKNNNLDGIDVWGGGKAITQKFVDNVKALNLIIYTWTIDDPIRATKLINMGVNGITTNKAHWLKTKVLGQLSKI